MMKARVLWVVIATALIACSAGHKHASPPAPWYPPLDALGNPVSAVFEGRVPCGTTSPPGCEKVKVALALYRDRVSAPASYQLARVYVASSPDGDRIVVGGAWRIAQGTKLDAFATVYELDSAAPAEFRRYWLASSDILLFLDSHMAPRAGNASWSYVLNRTP